LFVTLVTVNFERGGRRKEGVLLRKRGRVCAENEWLKTAKDRRDR